MVGAALGLVVGTLVRGVMKPSVERTTLPPGESSESPGPADSGPRSIENGSAWQYAVACRDGNWERVVDLTLWMRDRLAYVLATDGADSVPRERERLIADLGTRTIADNRLAEEGVEDPYVFSPGAKIDYDTIDAGRDDLDGKVARRTWLVVTYPSKDKALLDSDGVPIHSLRVGINVSTDGYVLKGNVIGNLDIDWESIMYDWPLP